MRFGEPGAAGRAAIGATAGNAGTGAAIASQTPHSALLIPLVAMFAFPLPLTFWILVRHLLSSFRVHDPHGPICFCVENHRFFALCRTSRDPHGVYCE